MSLVVITKNIIPGIHYWPDAPEEVAFLRFPHRHDFHIRCEIPVNHADREKEIFLLQARIHQLVCGVFGEPTCDFAAMSCEAIAEYVALRTGASRVEVLEDGAGGARYEARQV